MVRLAICVPRLGIRVTRLEIRVTPLAIRVMRLEIRVVRLAIRVTRLGIRVARIAIRVTIGAPGVLPASVVPEALRRPDGGGPGRVVPADWGVSTIRCCV